MLSIGCKGMWGGVDKDDEVQDISPLLTSRLLHVLNQAKPC